MTGDAVKKRRRVKLSKGDVFELQLPDGRFGYGMVVRPGKLKNGGTPYIAVFASAHKERPDLATLVQEPIALTGWTMDALVHRGDWTMIGQSLPVPPMPFPNFRVGFEGKCYVTDVDGELIGVATPKELELLDEKWSRAPIGFQRAFEALHGFRDWDPINDKLKPDYSRARMTRPG